MYDFPYVLPQLPGPSLTTHGTVAPASSCNGLAGIRGDSTYVQPYLLTSRYIYIGTYYAPSDSWTFPDDPWDRSPSVLVQWVGGNQGVNICVQEILPMQKS
jgi:hypothetical protein